MLLAEHKSIVTVPTWSMDTPPRYAIIPVLICVHAVPVFLKNEICQYFPRIRYEPYPLNTRGLGLSEIPYLRPQPQMGYLAARIQWNPCAFPFSSVGKKGVFGKDAIAVSVLLVIWSVICCQMVRPRRVQRPKSMSVTILTVH